MDRADAELHATGCSRALPTRAAGVGADETAGPKRPDQPPRRPGAAIVDGVDQPSGHPSRPHRPARYADLTAVIDAAGGVQPTSRAELAAATAAVVVQAGREPGDDCDERFVALADRVGIDTLAALWRDSDPVSLPGALWALYLLRQWLHASPDEVRRIWQAGEQLAPADAVVAGVSEPGDDDSMRIVADRILGGAYRGDFAVALERAAALFRVIAAGRRALAGDDERGRQDRDLAGRNDRVAGDLAAAAKRWRAGTLR
jgi:hypothetical protein